MNTALVIVDIQNDYFPDGKMPLVGPVEASQQAARLLEHFRRAHWPVIHIQHLRCGQGPRSSCPARPARTFT